MRKTRFLKLTLLGTALSLMGTIVAAPAATADGSDDEPIMLKGDTTASYFWDDGSGRNGDTGMPASGKPMQEGLAASPSWPLGTEGYVIYKGRRADFFVGDRGPGSPSGEGVMLDLDAKTFAKLTGGEFDSDSLAVDGNGGLGHIDVDYVITEWGDGPGRKNHPVAMSTGWYSRHDDNPAKPIRTVEMIRAAKAAEAEKLKKAKKAAKDRVQAAGQSAEDGRDEQRVLAEKRAARSADRGEKAKGARSDVASDIAPVSTSYAPGMMLGLALLAVLGGAAFFWYRRPKGSHRSGR